MTKPTAEEALEWLALKRMDVIFGDEGEWHIFEPLSTELDIMASGPTPLEAIRNAMKGESDD